MDEITLFHFKNRNTYLHSLNPVLKIFLVLIFSSLVILYNVHGLAYLSLFIILLINRSDIKIKEIILQSRFFLFFILCIFMTYSFSGNGKLLINFRYFKISLTGVISGSIQCWKFILFILCGIFFTSTTDPSSFKKAVFLILKPVPLINHRRFASISGMALTMLPKVLDNYKATVNSMQSRCFSENRNIYRKIKILSSAVITSNLINIKNTADAYISRNYNEETINFKSEISSADIIGFLSLSVILAPSYYFNYIFQ
ncbi:MAG: energy-coupling factor transporter transmembrane protein EcfT [Spirochaetes bacterium]|nr:energy-coupling factor transporter transmembrane protein EcfT [Spirochaetota bacterium]